MGKYTQNKGLLMRLIMLIIFFISVTTASAGGPHLERVRWACGYSFPLQARFDKVDGGYILLDSQEVSLLVGRRQNKAHGKEAGTLEIIDTANKITHIDVYRQGQQWSLACDNGVNMRIQSSYLDCKLAGVC